MVASIKSFEVHTSTSSSHKQGIIAILKNLIAIYFCQNIIDLFRHNTYMYNIRNKYDCTCSGVITIFERQPLHIFAGCYHR